VSRLIETVVGALSDAVRHQALDLASQVAQFDDVAALGEVALEQLANGQPDVTHALAWIDGDLAGYGQRDTQSLSAELAVAPDRRRGGLGSALAQSLMRAAPGLRLWAHGNLPAAQALANALGLVPVRQMVLMRAALPANLATTQTPPPSGVAFRCFRPGQDEANFLDLNAAVFAKHPEQGNLTRPDLAWRMRQDWFDPNGFFLAEQVEPPGQTGPIGYHWTKVQDKVAEVYVIGVHPNAQGMGLGTALLKRGLEHLARAGHQQVELYVEADNTPALAAYHRQGFTVARHHVQYARHVP